MKLYNNPKFAGTTIRKVKTDDGKPVALIGTVEDLFAAGLFGNISGAAAWEWCIAYENGKCSFFDTRENLIAHLKGVAA